jgi:hypothetical protein
MMADVVAEAPGLKEKTWIPTKKWFAGLAGSVASILASWIVTGAFDDVERGMAATALVGLVASYFKSNEDTPGGVPEKSA